MHVRESIVNLAERVRLGEFDDDDGEERARQQLMRIYRGAHVAPPRGDA